MNGLNNKGFTMLEMLFSFSIFCMVASFLPLFFTILFSQNSIDARIQQMEWELFINQLKKEVQASEFSDVVNGDLTLLYGEEIIVYQQYKNLVRRRVDAKGHEVVLQNVQEIRFEKRNHAIWIEVNNIFGQRESRAIHMFIGDEF